MTTIAKKKLKPVIEFTSKDAIYAWRILYYHDLLSEKEAKNISKKIKNRFKLTKKS